MIIIGAAPPCGKRLQFHRHWSNHGPERVPAESGRSAAVQESTHRAVMAYGGLENTGESHG